MPHLFSLLTSAMQLQSRIVRSLCAIKFAALLRRFRLWLAFQTHRGVKRPRQARRGVAVPRAALLLVFSAAARAEWRARDFRGATKCRRE
jgi:hypothetical protein